MSITVTLPYPPSTNKIWRSVQGRNIKSREYRDWEEEAGYVLVAQRPETITGPFHLDLTFGRPDKRRRDLGNLEKPVSDLLQKYLVIEDDCMAECITLRWGDVDGVRAVITSVGEHNENRKVAA